MAWWNTKKVISTIQRKYKISLVLEGGLFFLLSFLVGLKDVVLMMSFSVGFLSAFLPFVFFVWLFFFVKKSNQISLKRLYLGEIAKILLTISLIVLSFYLFKIDFFLFFLGYFFCLLINNLLPFGVNLFFSKQIRN